MGKYYVVDSEILPEILDKVVAAQALIQRGEVKRISEAVKRVGISRSAYYKYKDSVFVHNSEGNKRKAVISLMLYHRSGILSKVLDMMSQVQANIITINQNIPIHDLASVVISFDLSEMSMSIDAMLDQLSNLDGVTNVRLEAVE